MDILDSKIYMVEDHTSYLDMFSLSLDYTMGIKLVGHASSPETAMNDIRLIKPDLVIVDIGLQGNPLGGIRLIEEIREYMNNKVKIMVLTMHESIAYYKELMKYNINGYYLKSDSQSLIMGGIINILQKNEVYISPAILAKINKNEESPFDILMASMSPRETSVFRLIGQGNTIMDIAERYDISQNTVRTYIERIRQKLKIDNIDILKTRSKEYYHH